MRITVCDFPDEMSRKESAWSTLTEYLARHPSDILVLPEMPFCYWAFVGNEVDPAVWREAVEAHDAMIARMPELGARLVLGSRPIERGARRLNEAFVWSADSGYHGIRAKWYLPDAPDGRETIWFHRGDRDFAPVLYDGVSIGFQLCSEMMYPEHAREIGLRGGHLIAQPRATGGSRRWPLAAAMSAVTSGCVVVSANRSSFERDWFAGGSWLISPEGDVLAETTAERPFATASIDIADAMRAKDRYPRDMRRAYA
jgi:N-carbamoylputrescine amidase